MRFLLLILLLVPFILVPAFANIGFMPVYQPTSIAGTNPTELYCIFGEFLNSYNSTTNSFTCGAGGGGGENNTASNLSPGIGLFAQKSGVDLEFKSLAAGSNILIASNTTSVTISASGSAGEANTMSSPTHANSLVLTKVGVDLPIKGIACFGSATCSANSTDVTITVSGTSSLKVDTHTETRGNFITGINNVTGDIATQTFMVNTQSSSVDRQITGIDNVTGSITRNTFSVNTVAVNGGDTFINSINNSTGQITTKQFSVNTKDCGSEAVKSIDNSTGNVTCIAVGGGTAREESVATWTVDSTKTNIGATYVNVYTTGLGDPLRIDTNGKSTVTLVIDWTKVGAGTQKCIITTDTTFKDLITFANVVSGLNTNATQDIPTALENSINVFKPMCKSTTAGDDPIWLTGQVLLR